MHPEIIRDKPGSCPICGMAVEPMTATTDDANPELLDITRRFWGCVALAPALAAVDGRDGSQSGLDGTFLQGQSLLWFQLALATPVVLWGAWPFFTRG